MILEVWKDIQGYEGLYQISNKGRVKSLDRTITRKNGKRMHCGEKIMKSIPNSTGYLRVKLAKGKTKTHVFVHRLVAMHFVENPNKKEFNVVNHIDCNPKNNSFDNLEWTTLKGNYHHSAKLGRMKRTKSWLDHLHDAQRKTYKPVVAYDLKSGEIIAVYEAVNECKKDGFSPSCVCNCCKGIRKTHKGLGWRYSEGANDAEEAKND